MKERQMKVTDDDTRRFMRLLNEEPYLHIAVVPQHRLIGDLAPENPTYEAQVAGRIMGVVGGILQAWLDGKGGGDDGQEQNA
jgi:hypothetical protein